MTTIPRHYFTIYLQGRRAWVEHGATACCPYHYWRRDYWLDGFNDARLGQPDRYRVEEKER